MSDLIKREEAKEYIKDMLYKTALNNVNVKVDASDVFADIADYRLNIWVDAIPTAEPKEYVKDGTLTVQMPTIKEAKAVDKIVVYADTYKQEYHKPREREWCHTCKEYDQERHCCLRFICVIGRTVMELEEEYKPKVGKWIKIGYDIYECSECHQYVKTSDIDAYDWCHHCGAKMEENR